MPVTENACNYGDCLLGMAELANKGVDHLISDPPYEMSAHTGQVVARTASRNRHLKDRGNDADLSFKPLTQWDRFLYAKEFCRVTRGWIIVFCQVEAVALWKEALEVFGARYRRTCAWVKPNAMPQFSGDRPAMGEEHFVCAWNDQATGSKWNGGGKIGLYFHPIPRGDKRYHETQKPFSLMAEILEDFTNPNELVLDPFAGSGTTLVASKALGRRFIGFEQNEEYCKVANDRIENPDSLPERFRGSQLNLL